MRVTCVLLLSLLLCGSVVHAEEEEISIEVDLIHGVVVTDAQLDWIRAWLCEHLHPEDLAKIQVDVENRTHPGADYRAEARLTPRESGTYVVQRRIRFGHRKWRSWYVEAQDFVGEWHVEDEDVIQRLFDVDGAKRVMGLSNDLSYDLTLEVLRVIRRGDFEFAKDAFDEHPVFEQVWCIEEDDGDVLIRWGTHMRGRWVAGRLKDGRLHVTRGGMYIS